MVVIVLVFSCTTSTNSPKQWPHLPAFFKTEISALTTNTDTLFKTSTYNGHSTTQKILCSSVNWNKEWAWFLRADINKPVYYTHMQTSTSVLPNGNQQQVFHTNSSKADIQNVQIMTLPNHQIKSVSITFVKSNLLSATQVSASYTKDSAYTISGTQNILLTGAVNTFQVNGVFY